MRSFAPIRTQRLIKGRVSWVEYHVIDAGHDLIDPRSGAWDQVKKRALIFAASCEARSPQEASRDFGSERFQDDEDIFP